MTKPYYRVHLYMKSGNVITFHADEVNYLTGYHGNITKLSWVDSVNNRYPHLQTINPLQIEAITSEEIT